MKTNSKTKSKNESNKNSDNLENSLPCLSIFLSVVQNEYEQEKARTDRIDGKIISLMTIIVALITVYIPIFPFSQLYQFYNQERNCFTIPIVFSLFLLMGIIAILLSMYSLMQLVQAYKAKKYKAIDIVEFNNNNYLHHKTTYNFELSLIEHYQKIILFNSNFNTEKTIILNKQFKNAIIIFAMLSVSSIFTTIFVGL